MRHFAFLISVCFLCVLSARAQALLPEKVPVLLTGNDVVERAKEFLGIPYRSGQMNPERGFDCSGFTTYVYKTLNIALTRTSRSQYNEGKRIADRRELKKGDLVFFKGSRSSRTIGHVGIVSEVNKENGTFKFIHAGRRGICITSSTEPYYNKRYVGACRVLAYHG